MDDSVLEFWGVSHTSPTGLVWLKSKPGNKSKAGDPACTAKTSGGYYHGRLNKRLYQAHRVVFFLVHGRWPTMLDHIDGNRANNHPDNLREVSPGENAHNRVARGYVPTKEGTYLAQICVDRKTRYLGTYATPEEARRVYLQAKRALHKSAPERCYAAA